MKKLRQYFIGSYLDTDDVFERARATMLYRFTLMFLFLFLIPLAADVALGYEKAILLHGFDGIMLLLFPFIIRWTRDLDRAVNFFFTIIFFYQPGSHDDAGSRQD